MDEITLHKARKGDRESFQTAVLELKDKAYRIAYCYLHSEQDSMDAVCDAVEKAYVNIKKLKDTMLFPTWFIRIVINECKQVLRKKGHTVSFDENTGAYLEGGLAESEESMDLSLLFEKMGDIERTIIHMKYYQGYTFEEISQITGIPLGTVKTRLYGSLRSMKAKLEVKGV